jgi:hypothetical protein
LINVPVNIFKYTQTQTQKHTQKLTQTNTRTSIGMVSMLWLGEGHS